MSSSLDNPSNHVPLFLGTKCTESLIAPYYRCVSCARGEQLNGTMCVDVDECEMYRPCDILSTCVNQSPGFRCEPCPLGYEGMHAYGMNIFG